MVEGDKSSQMLLGDSNSRPIFYICAGMNDDSVADLKPIEHLPKDVPSMPNCESRFMRHSVAYPKHGPFLF